MNNSLLTFNTILYQQIRQMGNKQTTAHHSLNPPHQHRRSHSSRRHNNHILSNETSPASAIVVTTTTTPVVAPAATPVVNESQNDLRHNRNKKFVMDRLRRSLRESFRRKKEHIPESSKPHQWQADEAGVKAGTCVFPVKYLGCVEVFESRGMQVCEEALKVLRSSRRRAVKGTLFVTGDGLRVVDDETKGLIVDQTIEKVSFCAPDRSHERGFSYICRDGTTRRWMCHGFNASKDSGERLSHAVGCAFSVCLERKQKRDKETVSMNFDPKTSVFTRNGSFRQSSLTERMVDPQVAKPTDPPPIKQVHNPFAVERPHATPNLLQRQGSLRGGALNTASPFKRQLSLRVNDLPSNQERQRAHSVDLSANRSTVMPIPEASPNEPSDSISAMCQELAKGLTILSNNDDPFLSSPNSGQMESIKANEPSDSISAMCQELAKGLTILSNNDDPFLSSPSSVASPTQTLSVTTNSEIVDKWSPLKQLSNNTYAENWINESSKGSNNTSPETIITHTTTTASVTTTANPSITALLKNGTDKPPVAAPRHNSPNLSHLRQHRSFDDGYNGGVKYPTTRPYDEVFSQYSADPSPPPSIANTDAANNYRNFNSYIHNNNNRNTYQQRSNSVSDPFDAEWAALASRHQQTNHPRSTNPFTQTTAPVKAFEVQM
ncbi:unnamed protein product [Medioppia subpectinata]|uniref:PID domain-containing protein n=1 Tax=Medioppia subpectinata TaxID=1979941 RepID=A0A7R9L3C3_9ACAR|nr:unnamed protein product [Medioppia subpectinata]CAG2114531.1 unnamed protein product [Medioppia subpectinata]